MPKPKNKQGKAGKRGRLRGQAEGPHSKAGRGLNRAARAERSVGKAGLRERKGKVQVEDRDEGAGWGERSLLHAQKFRARGRDDGQWRGQRDSHKQALTLPLRW